MAKYSLSINGKMMSVEADADTPLLWVLRDNLNLVGTKFGCGVAQCGAMYRRSRRRGHALLCLPVSAVGKRKVVTIEGLSEDGNHPLQKAWEELDVSQCGYCQSGQLMAASTLLKSTPEPTDQQIDEAMTNICRCGTQVRIRKAIHLASKQLNTK